jgi:hypothetical protein
MILANCFLAFPTLWAQAYYDAPSLLQGLGDLSVSPDILPHPTGETKMGLELLKCVGNFRFAITFSFSLRCGQT